jgi:hypothetical protein
MRTVTVENVVKFLWEDIICRHGIFVRLVIDGGLENKGLVTELAKKYKIKRVIVSTYYP